MVLKGLFVKDKELVPNLVMVWLWKCSSFV